MVAVLAIPLAVSLGRIAAEARTSSQVTDVAQEWADAARWTLESVEPSGGTVIVRVAGGPPAPASEDLRRALDEAGLADVHVQLLLAPEKRVDLPASAGE